MKTTFYYLIFAGLILLSCNKETKKEAIASQDCDCTSEFQWLQKTFEENDAGFAYHIKEKGELAYASFNAKTLEKVKKAKTYAVCKNILFDWLHFFRMGHVGFGFTKDYKKKYIDTGITEDFSDWQKMTIDIEEFKKYLAQKKSHDYEGIWKMDTQTIGIKKQGDAYIGFIITSEDKAWKEKDVRFEFTIDGNKIKSTFYIVKGITLESDDVVLMGENHLQVDMSGLERMYPKLESKTNKLYADYHKVLTSKKPYIEELNKNTLYFRIPSFNRRSKAAIDSVINKNKEKILSTKNLIIDIHYGTGGSDISYREILPFLYTNPIRTPAVEYRSTELNNKRMLKFMNDSIYAPTYEDKKWYQGAFDKLEKQRGGFVRLSDKAVSIKTFDKLHQYPKNVSIIINGRNASSDEQFILAAKQSKKVKLFGQTTAGMLDFSNMYSVTSPSGIFWESHCLTRSQRVPDFAIDGKGLQPDIFLDKTIPLYEWTQFVAEYFE